MNQMSKRAKTKNNRRSQRVSTGILAKLTSLILHNAVLTQTGSKITFSQFKPIHFITNDFVESYPKIYNLAITQDYKPLIIPKDIKNTKQIKHKTTLFGEAVTMHVGNAIFVSKDKILLLWKLNQDQKLKCYLADFWFTTFTSEPVIKITKETEFGYSLFDQTNFNYFMKNVPVGGEVKSTYTLIMNKHVQILRSTDIIDGFKSKDLLSFANVDLFYSAVFEKVGKSRFYVYFNTFNNGTKVHTLVSSLLDLSRLGSDSSQSAFSETKEIPFLRSNQGQFFLRDTGIKPSPISPYSLDYQNDKFFWANQKVGIISLKEGSSRLTITTPGPARVSPVDIAAPSGTTVLFLICNSNDKSSVFTHIHIYRVSKYFASGLKTGLTSIGYTHLSNFVTRKISMNSDHTLIFFGGDLRNSNWLSIRYVGELFRQNCHSGKVNYHNLEQNKIICREITDFPFLKNCHNVQPLSLSCLECSAEARSKGYELVLTPSPAQPMKKTCMKPPSITCQHPKYLNPTGEECFDCGEVLGCQKCLHFTQECLECKPGFGYDSRLDSCFSCPAFDPNCLSCHTVGLKRSCLNCEKGYFLIAKTAESAVKVCGKCPENCDKCSSGHTCQVCSPGFKRKMVNGGEGCVREECRENEYFDLEEGKCKECDGLSYAKKNQDGSKTCEAICSVGEFVKSKEERSCEKCDAVPENGDCAECDRRTGVCQMCKTGSRFIDGTKFCRKSCQVGGYWGGKTENRCHSCSKDSNRECSECEDLTGVCSQCSEGYLLEDGFCQKKCDLDKQYWSGRDGNNCLECQEVDGKCIKCANITGECLQCASNYKLINNSCQASCKEKGEYWSLVKQTCLNCSPSCLRCQDDTGKCIECGTD